MMNILFVLCLFTILSGLLVWGFKTLPAERWQIIASVPSRRNGDGVWDGVNLTWYGALTANAYALAVAMVFILLGSVGAEFTGVIILAAVMMGVCVPAARIVARIVEKKSYTFTVGGAAFVGIIMAPWAILIINHFGAGMNVNLPIAPALAAAAIGYTFGEGIGRLACISFGCCYGKPISKSHPWIAALFSGTGFIFHGKTKKIAYESGLDGERVIPIQAVTSTLYAITGVASVALFLSSHFIAAFLLSIFVTQIWRLVSEIFRADYRGGGKISAYQIMGVISVVYSAVIAVVMPMNAAPEPVINAGLAAVWNPETIIILQFVWLAIFLYTGRSMVTGAKMSFHVNHDRI